MSLMKDACGSTLAEGDNIVIQTTTGPKKAVIEMIVNNLAQVVTVDDGERRSAIGSSIIKVQSFHHKEQDQLD